MIEQEKYQIHYFCNQNNAEINNYVNNTDNTSLYHLTEWCSLINHVFKHDTYYFYAKSVSNEIIGILPVVRIKSKLFGNYMVSMPYFNYGGAIANHSYIEEDLMEKAISIAKELNVKHIEFRDIKHRKQAGWPVRTDKVNMIMQLPENINVLNKKLGSKIRAQIKRPQREGVQIINGHIELCDEFYDVFSHNMRDLGTPVYSKKLFIEILKTFPDKSQIFIVRLQNKPVGAAFLISFSKKLEIPWASTLKKYNSLGINMYMYWEILKYAIENKYQEFDFGRSTINSGTYRFKKQWGAVPLQLYWHYWLNDGEKLPQLNITNEKYKFAIKVWKNLPLIFTNWIGPKLVKNLP